jgi:hypothetical protein
MQVEIMPSLIDLYKLRGDFNLGIEAIMTKIEDVVLAGCSPESPEVQTLEAELKTLGQQAQQNNLNIQAMLADRRKVPPVDVATSEPIQIKFDPTNDAYAAAHLLRVATGTQSFDIDRERSIVTLYHTTEGDYIWCEYAYDLGWQVPRNTVDYKNYLSVRRSSWLRFIDGVGVSFPVVAGFVTAFHQDEDE